MIGRQKTAEADHQAKRPHIAVRRTSKDYLRAAPGSRAENRGVQGRTGQAWVVMSLVGGVGQLVGCRTRKEAMRRRVRVAGNVPVLVTTTRH